MPKIIGTSNTIGSLATSFLSEAQFQALNGPTWVICAGQALPGGSKYFQITGLSNAPDVRGRAIAGKDNMNGSQANVLTTGTGGFGANRNVLGGIGGVDTHTLDSTQMPSHTHTDSGHTHAAYQQGVGLSVSGGATPMTDNVNVTSVQSGVANIQNAGGGLAHPNTQPTMIANIFIKINP